MIYAAVMGYGTIGSGVVEVLEQNKDVVKEQTAQGIEVKYVLDLRGFPGTPIEHKVIHDFEKIRTDEEVRIVVETMGGLNPAYPWVKACLEAGKHVVTSNKALVAAHGTELLQIAREKNVNFLFEASVGGGIPIIRPIYRCLMGEKIEEVTGILNGTTNYILTKMDREGASFDDVLKEAQALGYAERNPEADVEGHDTCRKLAILTAMVTGKEVNYEDIHTEGITGITAEDFKYAKKINASIKLFGSSRIESGSVHAWVAPILIGPSHPLFAVNDVFNGIMVRGNMLGTTMFYGRGAGKLPTASAVVADMIEAAQNPDKNIPMGWQPVKQTIAPMNTTSCRYLVRISGTAEKEGKEAEKAFVNVQIVEAGIDGEFAVLTGEMTEEAFSRSKESLPVIKFIRAEL